MRRRHFNVDIINIAIDKEVHDYLVKRKLHGQPMRDVISKIISEYRLQDISSISERADNLAKVNEFYLQRIHELERKQQTVLISQDG